MQAPNGNAQAMPTAIFKRVVFKIMLPFLGENTQPRQGILLGPLPRLPWLTPSALLWFIATR